MSNYDLEEDNLLKLQIFLSVVFIVTLLISITLSYNSMSHTKKIYKNNQALHILKFNRIISTIVAIGFLMINIDDKKIKEKYKKQIKNSDIQILASIITLISTLIVLYVAFSSENNITSNENPN